MEMLLEMIRELVMLLQPLMELLMLGLGLLILGLLPLQQLLELRLGKRIMMLVQLVLLGLSVQLLVMLGGIKLLQPLIMWVQ